MKHFLSLFVLIFALAPVFADETFRPRYEYDDYLEMELVATDGQEDIVPNEQTAVAIAVAVLSNIYGAEHIEREASYNATEHDGFWYVSGTLPKGKIGGVAHIKIRKKDGAVMGYIHTK